MKRWTPALALLCALSPAFAGDIRSLDAPAPLPTDKPIVAPLDPSAAAVLPLNAALTPAVSVELPQAQVPQAQLPQAAVTQAAALPSVAAQSNPAAAQKSEAAAAQKPLEANEWTSVFDGAHAAQALSLDAPAPRADAAAINRLVARLRDTPYKGVSIQQEHEGSLVGGADSRDSGGTAFDYYRPVELRPELVKEVKGEMSKMEKVGYFARALFSKDEWRLFSTRSQLRYLAKLEAAVGSDKAWRGRTSLLLTREKSAPAFLDEHPQFEEAPTHDYDALPYKRYIYPEITTAKDAAAKTVREAIGRAKLVIEHTAHAGIHYHVFMTLPRESLRKELPRIESLLQVANDAYFAEAAGGNPLNLANRALSPWHRGRSKRVEQIVMRGAPDPYVSKGQDADSEKHVPLAFRYWGTKDGQTTVSFELRAVDIPFVRRGGASEMVKGVEGGNVTLERDYAKPERQLVFISAFADAILRGRLQAPALPAVELDEAAVDRLAAKRAKELGMPDGSYVSIGDFSRAVFGTPRDMNDVLQGLLLPFAAGADEPAARADRDELLDVFLKESARVKGLSASGLLEDQKRVIQYQFWTAYAAWAQSYARARQGRLDRLFVSLE